MSQLQKEFFLLGLITGIEMVELPQQAVGKFLCMSLLT
jgi:hypothetical protein